MIDEKLALLRTHRNNVSRYRRLLNIEITELERQFIEQRLTQEKYGMETVAASAFPLAFRLPQPMTETNPAYSSSG
jgi:hypothetical protein